MGTETIHPEWVEAPIVRFALDQAGPSADALTVLETLHQMMTDLEGRAPGVPFGEILRAWDPDAAYRGRAAARAIIETADMSDEEREAVLRFISLKADPLAAHPQYETVIALAKRGVGPKDIVAQTGLSKSAVYRMRMSAGLGRCNPGRWEPTEHPRFNEIVDELTAEPRRSPYAIAKALDLSERLVEATERHLVEEGVLDSLHYTPIEGARRGRPKRITAEQVTDLLAEGLNHTQIAAQLGCSRRTVFNIVKEIRK